jgi:hypothetical protein
MVTLPSGGLQSLFELQKQRSKEKEAQKGNMSKSQNV